MTEIRGQTKGPGAHDGTEAGTGTGETSGPVFAAAEDAVVRRTKGGWRVGGVDVPDLTSAMVLADLLAAELRAPEPGGAADTESADADTEGSVQAEEQSTSETGRLRATVGQLEHALMARVRVEQAIGVLAERHRIQPRQAFEQLRTAARSRGRRVIDIASDVVASATNPLLQLPDELSRPRSTGRQPRPARGILGSD